MICPKCGKDFDRLLALSRRDNKTNICDNCGTVEALEDFGVFCHLREKEEKNVSRNTRTLCV